jgi:carbon monoxide dehydrogenase subunit G
MRLTLTRLCLVNVSRAPLASRLVAIEAHGATTIARPVDEIFDYLSDARNEPRWLPGASSVEKTSDGPVGLGSTFSGDYRGAGSVQLELVEFERPRRVTFRARSRIVDFDDAVELTPVDGGTRLEARMTAQPRGAMRLVSPLMARTMRASSPATGTTSARPSRAGSPGVSRRRRAPRSVPRRSRRRRR